MSTGAEDIRALRGVPSLVWRAGQERRLALINAVAPLAGARVLVDGCGIGLCVRAIARYTPHVIGLDIEEEYLRRGVEAGIPICCAQQASICRFKMQHLMWCSATRCSSTCKMIALPVARWCACCDPAGAR